LMFKSSLLINNFTISISPQTAWNGVLPFISLIARLRKVEKEVEVINVQSMSHTSSALSSSRHGGQRRDSKAVLQARVKATGRIGTVLQQDPVDDNDTYKIKFLDGADPTEDCFAKSEVEVSTVAEASNEVPALSRWEEVRRAMERGAFRRAKLRNVSPPDAGGDMYTVNGEAIVSDFGISGLCLVSKREDITTVILISAQSFFLQAMILFYITHLLKPHAKVGANSLPTVLVDAAIYLHFISCVGYLPRSIFVLKHFREVHTETLEFVVIGFVFIVDAFVTPLFQLFIGALFLCTSVTVADVIMNACAVAYVAKIDNLILEVRKAMNELGLQPEAYDDIHIPVNVNLIRKLNTVLCVVPLLPFTFSCIMGYLGLRVLEL